MSTLQPLRRFTASLIGVVLALLCTPAHGQAPQPDIDVAQKHRAAIAKLYQAQDWTRGPARTGMDNQLQLDGWEQTDLQAIDGRLTRRFTRTKPRSTNPSFLIESYVASTPRQAHSELLMWLGGLQSPAKRPALSELDPALADVGYFSRSGAGPNAIAWIAMVRGNVAVRILAYDARQDPDLDLVSIARGIDKSLLRRKIVPAGVVIPQPTIAELSSADSKVRAGESLALKVRVRDPEDGTPHLRWILHGPGRGYVERSKDGTLCLYPTAPGSMRIELVVTGSSGTTTRRTLAVNVLE